MWLLILYVETGDKFILWENTMQPIVMATLALLPPLLPLSVGRLHHSGLIWIKSWFMFQILLHQNFKCCFELNMTLNIYVTLCKLSDATE